MGTIRKIQNLIREKIQKHERGLYIVLVFPIAFTCLVTFATARVVSVYWPWYYIEWAEGLHVHHFAYGFFVLAVSCYLALIFSGPRAKFLISLLYGVGLGLAFDEFAMWVHLREDDVARWQYDGLVVVGSVFLLLLTLQPGLKFLSHHWPFSRRKLMQEQIERRPFSWDDIENTHK
jgi:hypothetical protein